MKNIKSFHLFENLNYIDSLNKDDQIVDWLMTSRFTDEDDTTFQFFDGEEFNITTPYGENISAKFDTAENEYTGEGDWSFWSDYLDEYGILYQVFGHGHGLGEEVAYDNSEWDDEISNVELSRNFNAPKLIVRIHNEYPIIASKIYHLCDEVTKELIRTKLELSGVDSKETLTLFKGGSLLNRFGDI
jgi:hypothetical protein